MIQQDKGTLVLKAVPTGQVEDEVKAFLGKVFKNVSQERVAGLIEKVPVVLSKNVPVNTGTQIVKNLEKLGATVDFLPKTAEPKATQKSLETQEVTSFERESLSGDQSGHVSELLSSQGNWISRIKSSVAGNLAEVNKELWLILSLLILAGVMNYMLTAQRMVLGFYTLPTLFSAYFYGRRHATLTAFASVFLVGLLIHYNPHLLSQTTATEFIATRWFDLTAWASILVITAYAMGTLHEHHESRVLELRQTYHGLLLILRQFISKDKYTENHSYRVSIYATKIAAYLGLPPQTIDDIRDASLLHDIGKLDISRELLYKAARLTEEEFAGIKKHVEKGVDLLEPVGGPLRRIIPIILTHHDKMDGSGYHSVTGNKIPLEARVVSVADVYDSLTSDRPYRKAMSAFDAKEIIVKGSGTEFDSKVVNAFLGAFKKGELEIPEVIV
jgi:putative nucleotidyltransferase with HDIG domain